MSTNEITGDKQQTKPVTDAYRENYDKIFGKKKCQDTLNTNHAQAVVAETTLQSTPTTSTASVVGTCCFTTTTQEDSTIPKIQIRNLSLSQKT